jgi:hypothetical protein
MLNINQQFRQFGCIPDGMQCWFLSFISTDSYITNGMTFLLSIFGEGEGDEEKIIMFIR